MRQNIHTARQAKRRLKEHKIKNNQWKEDFSWNIEWTIYKHTILNPICEQYIRDREKKK